MIYSTVAIIILIVIIYHERDLKAVAKAEQERKELIKQLEKELEELKKAALKAEYKTKALHTRYMERCTDYGLCVGILQEGNDSECVAQERLLYEAMRDQWDTLSNKRYSTERKIDELRNFYRR